MPHYCGIPQSEEEETSDKADERTTAIEHTGKAEANRVALTKETVC